MKYSSRNFYCFSPPVMLATFIIELAMLIYTLARYKMNTVTRLVAAMLAGLAVFQLAEYFVCDGLVASAEIWSRIGFVSITMLPPLGLHLAHAIAKRAAGKLVFGAYATAAIWILVFGINGAALTGNICAGNYVIFQLTVAASYLYSVYYYGWLFAAIIVLFTLSREVPSRSRALRLLIFGYFSFMFPTAIVNTVNSETINGIPSIMCGFAVLLALILVLKVLPAATSDHDLRG